MDGAKSDDRAASTKSNLTPTFAVSKNIRYFYRQKTAWA